MNTRSGKKSDLQKYLPYGYHKRIVGPYSQSMISLVVVGKRKNKGIKDQLGMLALETLLEQLINGDQLSKMITASERAEGLIRKLWDENVMLKSELEIERKKRIK